jgi:hypothetical protein
MAAVPAAAAAAFLKRHLAALKLLDRERICLKTAAEVFSQLKSTQNTIFLLSIFS